MSNFYGGVHPAMHKALTSDKPIKRAFVPRKVVLPLSQHVGSPAVPAVAVGDTVKLGQVVARQDGFISANVHASIAGKVTRVGFTPTPTQGRTLAITIESQGGEDQAFKPAGRDPQVISADELLTIIRDAGLVGMGGAAFPTAAKLSPPKTKKIDAVIMNGAECEPYLTCDYRLMVEKPREILKGLDIIAKVLGVKDVYLAVEDNKRPAVYALEQALAGVSVQLPRLKSVRQRQGANFKIVTVPTKYPQGAEKQLIKALLGRVVPAGGLPMDVGCICQNAGTIFSVFEAVYGGKPLIERAITISGDCVRDPVNLWVRLGTLVSDLVAYCGGLSKEPAKVIMGGPMMGIAQFTTDIPVMKGSSGLLFFSRDALDDSPESVCIRCGKCLDVCPIGLVPTTLMQRVKKEQFAEAKALGVAYCYECGTCAYACPAKIPLLDYMKYGKSKLS